MKAAPDSLIEVAGLFVRDPLGFVQRCFEEVDLDEWQIQFLSDLGRLVQANQFDPRAPHNCSPIRMAVASGHGIGKSTLIAFVFWWIMCTRVSAKLRVTANTFTQLEATTWSEIQRWGKRCIFNNWFEITGGRVHHKEARESWFGIPITCAEENSQAFAGQHNRASTSAFLFDESSHVPDSIWEVADNGLTDGEPMWFAFGNMIRNTGKFYEACFGSWQHRWNARSIDSRSCKFPNPATIQEWLLDHGEDSDYFKTRVRGLPPSQSEAQLISLESVRGAQQRVTKALEDDPLIAGVDVPDGGSAWFIVRYRRGLEARPSNRVPAPVRVAGSRTDRSLMIATLSEILSVKGDNRVDAMFIDTAFGAPIVERLKGMGHRNVEEVSFGAKSPDPRFGNMRAFMWGRQMKDWLAKGSIDHEDRKLASDLVGPGFHLRVGGDGTLLVESKDAMRKRGIASPDDGDAFALTFARYVPPREMPRKVPQPIPRREYAPFG